MVTGLNAVTAAPSAISTIDGLPVFLQSVGYLRAAISASANVPAEETDQRVKAGQQLRELRSGRGLQCTFYVHELALYLPVGGHEVHVEQVHDLLLMAVRSNTTIRTRPQSTATRRLFVRSTESAWTRNSRS